MNYILERPLQEASDDAPSDERIDGSAEREAVHEAFEKIVTEIDATIPPEVKKELEVTPSRKNEGDTDRSDKYRY